MHTLTAVARDTAGNVTTSTAVTVTVFNDTTPPAVSLTSPASGATVSGTITVTASASDDVGVVGVQFRLDGAPLGAEDTTNPYAISWDTTSASNGSHTLTAVARDGAGHTTTSTAVTMTVANSPSGTVTRIEETSAAVSYVGPWLQDNTQRAWSGGTAALGFAVGQQATLSFTGTGVSWIGLRGPQTGSPASTWMAPWSRRWTRLPRPKPCRPCSTRPTVWCRRHTGESPHTVRIDVTGLKNPAATSPAFVVVDAFDVSLSSPGPPVRRLQQTESSISYTLTATGGWNQSSANGFSSDGTNAVSRTVGDQATLTFTGTSVRWIGQRGFDTGIAHVHLDGVRVATIDTRVPFASQEEFQAALFSATGLLAGEHTLMIEVTGRNGELSDATVDPVVVDAFDIY